MNCACAYQPALKRRLVRASTFRPNKTKVRIHLRHATAPAINGCGTYAFVKIIRCFVSRGRSSINALPWAKGAIMVSNSITFKLLNTY